MKTKFWLTGTMMMALCGIGCSSPPSAKEVSDTTAARTSDMIRATSASARAMGDMSAFKSLGSAMDVLQGSFAKVPVTGSPSTCTDPNGCVTTTPSNPVPSDPTAADAEAALVEKFLRERIFIEANVESTDGDSTIFRIHGTDVCTPMDTTAAVDPSCVQAVDQMELRIRATSTGKDSLDLGFQLSSKRTEPLVLSFGKDTVAVDVDLAQSKDAIQFLSPNAATQLPRVMVGKVELRLTKNGEQDLTFSTGVLDAIQIEVDDNGATHSFSTGKANPLSQLRMDGINKRVGFDLNLGTTEYKGPYGGTSSLSSQQVVYSLSGLSFSFSAQEGQDDFVVAHVGIGDAQSYMSLNGTKVFTADLNAASGRHFDLNLTKGADGLPLVRVLPEFDLVTKFFMAPLKADATASVPSFYEDQTYHVRLSGGTAPSFRPVQANTATGFPGGLQVVSGELSMSGNNATVTVPAGKCLVSTDTVTADAHPLLGHFQTRDCQ